MLDNFEFRHCSNQWQHCKFGGPNCDNSAVFETLTHSSRYVPEIMQASRNIRYTDINSNAIAKFSVSQDSVQTVSGRLAGWLDLDGSLFPGAFPNQSLILGSRYANSWWKTHEFCLGPRNNYWICPKGQDSTASIYISYDIDLEQAALSETVCPNGAGPCPTVGWATHFGRTLSQGLEIGQNPKVTGPVIASAGGWYVKFNSGSPKTLKIKNLQVFPDANLVLAFPYPRGTTFSVKAKAPSWCSGWARTEEVLVQVNSLAEVRAGNGDRWFYDAAAELLYIRVVQKNEACFPLDQVTIPWPAETIQTLTGVFTRNGMTLMVMEQYEFHYEILASGCGGNAKYCSVLSGNVPPAVSTEPPHTPATWAPTPPTFAPTNRPTPPCVANWAQCGDEATVGCCIDPGYACIQVNQWYRQCQPRPATSAPTGSSPPTSKSPTTQAPTSRSPTTQPPSPTVPSSNPPQTTSPTVTPTTSRPTTGAPTSLRPTAAPVPQSQCSQVWEQCAGEGYTGPKCCGMNLECVYDNPWYSQCQPVAVVTAVPTTKQPTSKAPTNSPSTRQPTSKAPTTQRPTTKAPTRAPTTKQPTTKAPTKAPTTRRPTAFPTRRRRRTG